MRAPTEKRSMDMRSLAVLSPLRNTIFGEVIKDSAGSTVVIVG